MTGPRSGRRTRRRSRGAGRTGVRGLLLAMALATVSGCGSGDVSQASASARSFTAAVARSDGPAACRLLAPATAAELAQSTEEPCARAVLAEGLGAGAVRGASAFGTMAQVRFSRDTVFMAEFPSGWKVMAAGCTARSGKPYDCRVQGG